MGKTLELQLPRIPGGRRDLSVSEYLDDVVTDALELVRSNKHIKTVQVSCDRRPSVLDFVASVELARRAASRGICDERAFFDGLRDRLDPLLARAVTFSWPTEKVVYYVVRDLCPQVFQNLTTGSNTVYAVRVAIANDSYQNFETIVQRTHDVVEVLHDISHSLNRSFVPDDLPPRSLRRWPY